MEDPTWLADAFGADLRFGTGGIRCAMGLGPNRLNRLTVARVAKALATVLGKGKVVISYDTRDHSREFAETVACVLSASGLRVLLFSLPMPTPVLSFAIRDLGCAAGVSITASHNPREDNGIKVYNSDGVQATDKLCGLIEARMDSVSPFEVDVVPFEDGISDGSIAYLGASVLDAYVSAVLSQRAGVDCSGLQVIYSSLHGTGLDAATRVMRAIGVSYSVVEAQCIPDGSFTTCPKPNPELVGAMEAGTAQMPSEGAQLFIATDPDAGRLGVVVNNCGSAIHLSGDDVGLLLFDWLCRVTDLPAHPIAYSTIVGTPLANDIAAAYGVEMRRTLTGFKYIGEQVESLSKNDNAGCFMFAMEESLGYLHGTYARDKDGVLALMLVCECAAWHTRRGYDLVDALRGLYKRYGFVANRQVSVFRPNEKGKRAIQSFMRSLRADAPCEIGAMSVSRVIDYSEGVPMPVSGSADDAAPAPMLPKKNVLELGSSTAVK